MAEKRGGRPKGSKGNKKAANLSGKKKSKVESTLLIGPNDAIAAAVSTAVVITNNRIGRDTSTIGNINDTSMQHDTNVALNDTATTVSNNTDTGVTTTTSPHKDNTQAATDTSSEKNKPHAIGWETKRNTAAQQPTCASSRPSKARGMYKARPALHPSISERSKKREAELTKKWVASIMQNRVQEREAMRDAKNATNFWQESYLASMMELLEKRRDVVR